MKGKNVFTSAEIAELRALVTRRQHASHDEQKKIRNRMRAIGFYGQDDWGIRNCQLSDLDELITSGRIKIVDSKAISPNIKPIEKPKTETPMCKMKENINFKTIDDLRQVGFTGFISIADLWKDSSVIPNVMGVYLVVYSTTTTPEFLTEGTGGYYKGKDPNVSIDELRANWIDNTCVVYIGKAGDESSSVTLRSRLKKYLRFGQKIAAGHWGGRYIWQLKNVADLLICWCPISIGCPRTVEAELIAEFKRQYNGRRPFANLKD